MDFPAALQAMVSVVEQASEQAVLERLVEVAGLLTGAGYSAALLIGPDDAVCALAHRGMTAEQVAVLPHLPRPVGLIGTVLRGEVVRLTDMAAHPESIGFPAAHVPMAAFLGVPVMVEGRVLGGLYLTRAPGHGEFSDGDVHAAGTVVRLAGAAAASLRRGVAHEAVLERLGVTDTRAGDAAADVSPAIRRLLAAAREVLGMDLAFLSRLSDGTQTFTHVDTGTAGTSALPATGGLDGLVEGASVDAADGYCAFMVEGQIPPAVPDVAGHPLLGGMPVTAALGVGGYCGVPVPLPDGSLYGSLCGLHSRAGAAPSPAQVETMRILARLIGERLQHELRQDQDRRAQAQTMEPFLDGTRRSTVLQPIVDLRAGATAGFEALSRFTEATGAPRRPDEVFGHAHALGVGVRLEQAAARDAIALIPALPGGTYLSVNLSPQALMDPATFDLLSAALRDGAAGRLVVELTEHEHVPDYPALLHLLDGLRGQGLRLAVDDTGSGFASLQHVARLRPDILKLDTAFVRDVHLDASKRAVVRALIGFAADLGAALITEGIENAAELEELLRLGATHGQGYHLGRPQPPDRALAQASRSPAETETAA